MQKQNNVPQLRMRKRILHILLEFFLENQIQLMDGNSVSVFVSDVEISPDMRNVKIYVDISDFDKDKKSILIRGMNNKYLNVIKSLFARTLNLKYVPEPLFRLREIKIEN